jgi:paraquat-inducible protein B
MTRDNRFGFALIGAFVLIGVVLAFMVTMLVGGGRFGSDQASFISYFNGTVKGLNVGAQVSFRGARIGNVAEIGILYDHEADTVVIPVVMNIDRASIGNLREIGDRSVGESIATRLISRGLRAQLALESIVTGQLYVQLDFHPDSPGKFFSVNPPYPEIPTLPSKLEILQKKLENLPLERIAASLENSLSGLESVVNSDDMKAAIKSLSESTKHSDDLFLELTDILRTTKPKILRLIKNIDRASVSLVSASSEAELTSKDIHRLTPKLESTLGDISQSARSFSKLSDTLQRQPEALLKGKK